MKKFIRSAAKVILTLGVCMGGILFIGESEDLVSQFIWSISWGALALICGLALYKLFPEDFKNERA